MRLSIGFFTGRDEPRLDWLVEALVRDAEPTDELEIIVVDALFHERGQQSPECVDQRVFEALGGREHRTYTIRRGIDQRTYTPHDACPIKSISEHPPKPNIWQGKYRVTSSDWWAVANARNTFLCLASHDYIAGIDDRGRPGPRWLATIRVRAPYHDAVIAGSYDKLVGPAGARTLEGDHRRQRYPGGLANCGGGWLYGCTFAMPLAWALEVNGFEEGNDGLTGEDYLFGLMLEQRGHRIDFVPELHVRQDREDGDHSKNRYRTLDKGIPPVDKSHAALERFGRRSRTELTGDLIAIRKALALGEGFPIPDAETGVYRDWYDDQPICEM